MKPVFGSVAALLMAVQVAAAQSFSVSIAGGKDDLKNAIVVVPLPIDASGTKLVAAATADGKPLVAQLEPPRLLDAPKGSEVSILVPELKAGQTLDVNLKLADKGDVKPGFAWSETEGLEQLSYDGQPILRYFHKPFDAALSPPDAKGKPNSLVNPTIKPYHQLFAPDGKTIITNNGTQGIYTHHRGIYWGFNNITYGDKKKADVWHCHNGEHTDHEKILAAEAGPLFGRQVAAIGWHGQDGGLFAHEKRELTVYHLPGGVMIDFAADLSTPLDKVHLDGDPQHAGFHFRADSSVQKNEKETVFIRPDGKGIPGDEKNWDPKTKMGPVNLPWDAMSFLFQGKRYTVVYLDNPQNPKESRSSERKYGRIGSYFVYDLTKDKPLKVKYRLWFQEGEPTVEECEALSKAFVASPVVKVAER